MMSVRIQAKREEVIHVVSLVSLCAAAILLPYSIKACHVSVIVFLLISIMNWKRKQAWMMIKENILLQFFIGFVLIHFTGMLYTSDVKTGWLEIEKKIFMFLVILAVGTIPLKYTKDEVNKIILFFIASCFFASVYCLVFAFQQSQLLGAGEISISDFDYLSSTSFSELHPGAENWMLFSYRALPSAIGLHPTYFSLYIAFSIIFLIHVSDTQRIKTRSYGIIAWTLIIYFSAFLVLLSTRIILISVFILLIARIFFSHFSGKKMPARLGAAVLILWLMFLIYINPVTWYRCYEEFMLSAYEVKPAEEYFLSTDIRSSLWWICWKSLNDINVVWGEGTGAASGVVAGLSERLSITNVLNTTDPHNQYVSALISHGIFGVILLLAILIIPLSIAWRKGDFLIFSFCTLIGLTCLTESTLELQKGIMFFTLFYALLVYQYGSYTLSIHPKFMLIRERAQ